MKILEKVLAWLLGKVSKDIVRSKVKALQLLCKDTLSALEDDTLSEDEAKRFVEEVIAVFSKE